MINPLTFLFDNGSLRPASTLNLREIAAELSRRIEGVEAVSLLHSSGVDPSLLDGIPARLLEPALAETLSNDPSRPVVLLPLFFGPSAALTEYVPARVASLKERFPLAMIELADPLNPVPEVAERGLVVALARVAQNMLARGTVRRPVVVLVDHGSPQPAVARVRDSLARALAVELGDSCAGVRAASMERRPGPEFAFNEPLLETCLMTLPPDVSEVIVLLQFLSPGRHAGPEGDIAEICQRVGEARPDLSIRISDTIGREPEIAEILARRWRDAVARLRA